MSGKPGRIKRRAKRTAHFDAADVPELERAVATMNSALGHLERMRPPPHLPLENHLATILRLMRKRDLFKIRLYVHQLWHGGPR